jgi:hypothetical protein
VVGHGGSLYERRKKRKFARLKAPQRFPQQG